MIGLLLVAGCVKKTPDQETSEQEKPSSKSSREIQTAPPAPEKIASDQSAQSSFSGTEGESVELNERELRLDTEVLDDNSARFYNTKLASGKTIYFFVIRDKNGSYRAAANACQVCFDSRMGFRQQGDYMVCNTCGNQYPLEKIATEKGGCNPGPINPNLEVRDGQIIIEQADLEQVADFF